MERQLSISSPELPSNERILLGPGPSMIAPRVMRAMEHILHDVGHKSPGGAAAAAMDALSEVATT